jgi:hypothetical protein
MIFFYSKIPPLKTTTEKLEFSNSRATAICPPPATRPKIDLTGPPLLCKIRSILQQTDKANA